MEMGYAGECRLLMQTKSAEMRDTGERVDRENERRIYTEKVYRSGEGTKEMEMGGMGGCMQAMQHTTAATASVRCTARE